MNRSIDSDIFYFVMYRGYTIYHARWLITAINIVSIHDARRII
jgi:hypothetical protein